MLKIRKVLFPTDFSECSNHAFPYALQLAERYGAELHMLHALALHAADPADPTHRFPEVEEVQAGDDGGGVRVFHVQQRGFSAAAVILDYAADHDVDLVVMGTHGRRGLRRFVMGSVAEEVIRFASSAVLSVRKPAEAAGKDEPEAGRPRRILAPIDFSAHSRTAFVHARELAAAFDAELLLLHVVHEIVYPDFYFPGSAAASLDSQHLRQEAVRRLEMLLEEGEGPPVKVEVAATVGPAAQEIVRFTREREADLIVIASHGLTGILEVLLGSVTERVVRLAPCSVLTLKAGGKSLLASAALSAAGGARTKGRADEAK